MILIQLTIVAFWIVYSSVISTMEVGFHGNEDTVDLTSGEGRVVGVRLS